MPEEQQQETLEQQPTSSGGSVYLKVLRYLLRGVAWLGSVALFMVLLVALLFTNLNALTPPLIQYVSGVFGGDISYGQFNVGWVDRFVVLRVSELKVGRDAAKERFDFSVDQLEVRLVQPESEGDVWEIAAIEFIKPRIVSQRHLQTKGRKATQTSDSFSVASVPTSIGYLLYVQQVDVIDGEYVIELVREDQQSRFSGSFAVAGQSEGDLGNLSLKITSDEDDKAQIAVNVASSLRQDGVVLTDVEMIATSVEVTQLASVAPNHPKIDAMMMADLQARVDASVYGHWTGDLLESIHFSITAQDPNLDGTIPDAKQLILKTSGKLDLVGDRPDNVEIDFEVQSFDLVSALDQMPGVFPPKFYNHAAQRVQSLWLTELRGQLSGDPRTLLRPDGDWELNAKGEFSNYTYQFNKRWPPIEGAAGVYEFDGKTVTITGTEGAVYGQSFASADAKITDFTVPDPILLMNFQLETPVAVSQDLFGRDGVVSPGTLNWIESIEGAGEIGIKVDVPLRRGKEFVVAGEIQVDDVKMKSTHGLEATGVIGQLQFDRYGITAGDLSGQMLNGPFTTTFTGTGTKGNFMIVGQSAGQAEASALRLVLGDPVGDKLTGIFDWDSTFQFAPQVSEINLTASFIDVVSTLPFPVLKGAGVDMPLNMTIQTKDKTTRSVDLSLGDFAQASVHSVLQDWRWKVKSGSVVIGQPSVDHTNESGFDVVVNLPKLDYGAWSEIMDDSESTGDLELSGAVDTVAIKAGVLVLPRQREIQNAQVVANKAPSQWDIDFASDSIVGNARYVSADMTQEGEYPLLDVELSVCHLPAASGQPTSRSTNPVDLPRLSFHCLDTQYGKYYLGESFIEAEPGRDSWKINRAQFNTPSTNLEASGDWFYDQHSKLTFNMNSVDFGKTMDDLGIPATFKRGNMKISGFLEWDAPLTQWSTNRTSGEIKLDSTGGTIMNDSNTEALKLVGVLNYDTIFKRFSSDIVDVLDEEGILYDKLNGTATIKNGVIDVGGIFVEGPSLSLAMTGKTDWNNKEHQLLLGVEPNIQNSLTTLAALLINPVTGALVYAGGKLADQVNLKFSYRYDVTGPWNEPVVKLVENKAINQQ